MTAASGETTRRLGNAPDPALLDADAPADALVAAAFDGLRTCAR